MLSESSLKSSWLVYCFIDTVVYTAFATCPHTSVGSAVYIMSAISLIGQDI